MPHKLSATDGANGVEDSLDTQLGGGAHANGELEPASGGQLKDLLLKPSLTTTTTTATTTTVVAQADIALPLLPNDMAPTNECPVAESFSKRSPPNEANSRETRGKIVEKVRAIKSSIANPFELFLPAEFRTQRGVEAATAGAAGANVWTLIRSRAGDELSQQASSSSATAAAASAAAAVEVNMIPLKQQVRMEKHQAGNGGGKKAFAKKNHKSLKGVDLTDAIIEFNRRRVAETRALGGATSDDDEPSASASTPTVVKTEQSEELNELISRRVAENLRSLSAQVKSGEANVNSSDSPPPPQQKAAFSYGQEHMSALFAKPVAAHNNNEYDPTAKIKPNRFDRMNKRRSTNALTRAKHSQSVTFKEPAASSSSSK